MLVPCLDLFLEIRAAILSDVKLTFALVFGAYILNLVTTVFTASVFVSNRTDIQGVRNIINQIVRLDAVAPQQSTVIGKFDIHPIMLSSKMFVVYANYFHRKIIS